MSNFMAMQPSNNSFQELIGNGVKYLIPKFQRDYSWSQEQWEELWADIETLQEEKYHYMGYVVLQRLGDHEFSVIDGQQRLITLSIIVVAALHKLSQLIAAGQDVESNTTRMELIRSKYIGFQHSVTLAVNNKLSLNRNNADYFKRLTANLEPANPRQLAHTNKLIRNAFRFFAGCDMGATGEAIAQKIEDISSGMIFTKIVVENDLNAYKVFETLNARGVQLSTPDLLKNFIFSVVAKDGSVSEDDLDGLDANWSEIISNLGEARFADFVRYHHNFQQRLLTKKKLFSAIKKLIPTPASAVAYLDSLYKFSPVYTALLNPDDSWWGYQDLAYREAKGSLAGLALFNIRQPLTVLMIGFEKFTPEEFVKLARYLYVLSIRYNVICHLSPNEQETVYNQMAMKIFDGSYKRASAVKNDRELFGRLYPDDARFQSSFEYHRMPSRQSAKKIRHLLAQIESSMGNTVNELETTLEHVCPYSPDEQWHNSFGEGVTDVFDRLGNMLLLLDRDLLARADFASKKAHYQQSNFELAKKVASYSEWNLASVNDYQSWLAVQAVKTWRVD